MLQDYSAAVAQPTLTAGPPRYDEVVAPDGSLRPAWKALAGAAIGLTREELQRISGDVVRFLSDDGVRYSRPGESPSWWRLDPVPIVVSAEEWAPLEVGLAQRTELLNAILVDLYGPQTLLSSRVIPPELVFGHAGFLRELRGGPVDQHPLLVSASDVTRTATGDWQVLADRTGAPSGIGYAMENRRVISRVVPELYRGAGLHRVAPFFQAVRAAMIDAAPGEASDPRVVLLSPGPQSETAYDQAFVASSLGFPLVQGSDLVVRDGIVWMRAFGRLERVDVIVRRVDASYTDPLELRGDSHLGVTGLVEAVRRGTVRVVNGLGSGVVENLGLAPFLARACEVLLDEPLRLPSIRSYWLGDPDELEQVRPRLEELTVRTIDRTDPTGALEGDDLLRRVEAEPHRFVAQERPHHSQAPALGPFGVQPEPVVIRTFTVRHGSAYRTLLGGLGSIMETGRVPRSKDVWVLKARPDEPDQRLLEVLPMTNVRAPAAMVPRVLEDMFWFGRYAERAEDTLRLVISAHGLAQDFRSRPWSAGGQTLRVLTRKLRDLSPSPFEEDAFDDELRSLLLDPFRPGSVAQSVASLRDAAQAVRDQLSPDVWRVFGAIDRAAGTLADSALSHQVTDTAGRMLTAISALHGVCDSMMRDDGWRMIMVGRAVERCQQVVRLLDGTVTERRGIDVDRDVLTTVLMVAESAVTHRRRYRGYVRPAGVVELLMFDADNPRSISFNVDRAAELLRALPASTGSTRPERLLADLQGELASLELASLVVIEGERRPHLEQAVATVRGLLSRFADAVLEVHLASAPTPRSFDLTRPTREVAP
ncbi:circularly permuted type 2 ATP-grasp protein [Aeromicrobium sp. Leaf350]|uniref:circularly permuted type 2 ATP-grasp protein n=1 Tax=Aeromicrobium sp. Leaf350 TaxID=2876565 RepID=UPI001E2A5697|nr:circularly permuted type 2 ATP-grasp protein [Aeromicrobium sp. Leaf350]